MSFRDEIRKIVDEELPVQVVIGEVKSVDESAGTCTVKDLSNEVDIYDVKLQAHSSDKGLLVIPETGSFVFVSIINNDERNCYVSGFSEVKRIELNGKKYGGLIKVEELKKQIDRNTQTLKALVNAIKTAPVAPSDGGASFKTSIVKSMLTAQYADLSNIENKEVQHGGS